MEKFILDTNLFFNMEAGLNMGKTTEEVVRNITNISIQLKKNKKAEFYFSPRVVDEFLSFFENKTQGFIQDLLSSITIKSPDIGQLQIPAETFSQLVEEIRLRSYRGLVIGEEEIKNTANGFSGKEALGKMDFEIAVGTHIKKFRERYRNATRTGFVDSMADFDCIILAKIIDGCLVSTDEGLLSWGRKFGIKEVPVAVWKKRLDSLLQ